MLKHIVKKSLCLFQYFYCQFNNCSSSPEKRGIFFKTSYKTFKNVQNPQFSNNVEEMLILCKGYFRTCLSNYYCSECRETHAHGLRSRMLLLSIPVHGTKMCHSSFELWHSLKYKRHTLQLPICLGIYIKRADK